jgi:hypothetical protein
MMAETRSEIGRRGWETRRQARQEQLTPTLAELHTATVKARLAFLAIDGPTRQLLGDLTTRREPLFNAVPGWREAQTAFRQAVMAEEAAYHALAERDRTEGGG